MSTNQEPLELLVTIRVRKRQGRILSKSPAVNLVFFRHLSPSKICLFLLRNSIWDWSISLILCLCQKMYKGCLSREVYDISTNAEGVTQSLEVGRGKRVTQPGYVSGQDKFRRHLFYYYFILFEWITLSSVQFISAAQSSPTLCDPMNRSTPGLPVHHQLPEFTQTHVHGVSDGIQPSHPLSSPSPPASNPSQHQSLFQWVNSLHEVAKVLEFQL